MIVTFTESILKSLYTVSYGASKDDLATVITRVFITRENDDLIAMATDRYMVLRGRYRPVDIGDDQKSVRWGRDGDFDGVHVSVKTLKTVLDYVKSIDGEQLIELSIDDRGPVFTVYPSYDKTDVVRFPDHEVHASGKFPPVGTLFPQAQDGVTIGSPTEAVSLKLDFLTRVNKMLPPFTGKTLPRYERDVPWRVTHTATDNPNRPGPVHLKRLSDSNDYELDALVQPNLLKR